MSVLVACFVACVNDGAPAFAGAALVKHSEAKDQHARSESRLQVYEAAHDIFVAQLVVTLSGTYDLSLENKVAISQTLEPTSTLQAWLAMASLGWRQPWLASDAVRSKCEASCSVHDSLAKASPSGRCNVMSALPWCTVG